MSSDLASSGLRVGVVGAGSAARMHAAALARLRHPFRIFSSSYRDGFLDDFAAWCLPEPSLDALIAAVDVVIVCTPSDTHLALAARAIAAGRHVICEKPLTLDLGQAIELQQLARDAGVMLLPAHVVRYVPVYDALYRAVRAGRLGRLISARFTRAGAAPRWSDWFADETRSGSIFFDQSIHDIDQAIRILGPAVRVDAQLTSLQRRSIESTGLIVLRHEGGAFSQIVGTWGPEGTPFRTTFRVSGTAGALGHDSLTAAAIRSYGAAASEQAPIHVDAGGVSPFDEELAELLAALEGGGPVRVSAQDGVAAVAVAQAAVVSAREGRSVELSSAAGRG